MLDHMMLIDTTSIQCWEDANSPEFRTLRLFNSLMHFGISLLSFLNLRCTSMIHGIRALITQP